MIPGARQRNSGVAHKDTSNRAHRALRRPCVDDRVYVSSGVVRWAFDHRSQSPTYKLLNVFTFSDRNRAILVIPRGVYHAVQNIGQTEAIMINLPTCPYDHADPDKYRLPIKNDLIPFDFDDGPGW